MTDERTRAEEEAGLINTILVSAGLAAFGIPPAIVIFQIYRWLRDGFWTPITIEAGMRSGGFDFPYTDWRGVQRIIEWIVGLPLALGILFLGVAVAAVVIPLHNRAEDKLVQERHGRTRRS